MIILIESKSGQVTSYGIKEIHRETKAAMKLAREKYGKEIRHDVFQTHIFIGKDGNTSLSVGLIYPDGCRGSFNVAL